MTWVRASPSSPGLARAHRRCSQPVAPPSPPRRENSDHLVSGRLSHGWEEQIRAETCRRQSKNSGGRRECTECLRLIFSRSVPTGRLAGATRVERAVETVFYMSADVYEAATTKSCFARALSFAPPCPWRYHHSHNTGDQPQTMMAATVTGPAVLAVGGGSKAGSGGVGGAGYCC